VGRQKRKGYKMSLLISYLPEGVEKIYAYNNAELIIDTPDKLTVYSKDAIDILENLPIKCQKEELYGDIVIPVHEKGFIYIIRDLKVGDSVKILNGTASYVGGMAK
jgi:hypothetical protein